MYKLINGCTRIISSFIIINALWSGCFDNNDFNIKQANRKFLALEILNRHVLKARRGHLNVCENFSPVSPTPTRVYGFDVLGIRECRPLRGIRERVNVLAVPADNIKNKHLVLIPHQPFAKHSTSRQ